MKLYALVGSSGTGKSYQAMKLCRKLNIEYLIDDGILINRQKKIAGNSAKKETTKVGAVKRAIFFWPEPRQEMKDTLASENPDSLLIIGTSIKMVQQIADNLMIDRDSVAEKNRDCRFEGNFTKTFFMSLIKPISSI